MDLLIGVYGYPYHVNLRGLKRFEYAAKSTRMHADVFPLDQCRYLYDLMPTLGMLADGLPVERQLELRICMSLIQRHSRASCRDLFHGSALAGFDEPGYDAIRWPKRHVIH